MHIRCVLPHLMFYQVFAPCFPTFDPFPCFSWLLSSSSCSELLFLCPDVVSATRRFCLPLLTLVTGSVEQPGFWLARLSSWQPSNQHRHGCEPKIVNPNGTLVCVHMDQNLRFPGGLILTHTHMCYGQTTLGVTRHGAP